MTDTISALIGAVATLLVGGIVGAWTLIQVRRKRKEARAAAHRAQAEQVNAWWLRRADSGDVGVALRNDSGAPVRFTNIIVARHGSSSCWSSKKTIGDLGPDPDLWSQEEVLRARRRSVNCSERRPELAAPDVDLIFRDQNRNYWVRSRTYGEPGGGDLTEVSKRLTVWCEAKRTEVLEPQLKLFEHTYGIDVDFTPFPSTELLQSKFNALRGRKDVREPDIIVGPHDWLGRLVAEDRLRPIVLSEAQYNSFHRVASRAMMIQGQVYGIPYTFDSVALFRNVDLAPDDKVPEDATFDDLVKVSQGLGYHDYPMLVQVGPTGDPYHLWPLWWSAGGDLLGLDYEGYHSPKHAEMEKILEQLASLAQRNVLRLDVGRDTKNDVRGALDLFCSGWSPFLICSARALRAINRKGLQVQVSSVPKLSSKTRLARPLTSAYGLFLNSRAENRLIAESVFSEFMAETERGLELYRQEQLPPVQDVAIQRLIADRGSVAEREFSPHIGPYLAALEDGTIMPSSPHMRAFWSALSAAQVRAVQGRPKEAARDLIGSLDRAFVP